MKFTLIVALLLIISTPSFLMTGRADQLNPGVYSKDSAPFGVPYKDWISRWWQWNVGMPASMHPRENYTSEKCTHNQSGPVWFLADILTGIEDRTCTIPAGKAILVPLLTGECENSDPSAIMSDSELEKCAKDGDEYGEISATLNGMEIKNLDGYRTHSGFFNITIVKDNIFDNKPGTYKGIADGFFVFLEPLPTGKHDLILKTGVTNPETPSYNYAGEAYYHLIIEP